MAASSVSRIGELGLSAGVVKFVAEALGQGNVRRAIDVIQTIALTLGFFMALLLVLGYPLFVIGLGYFLPVEGVPIALEILPYALMSLWMMVMVSVFSGGLDGCMRMDFRSYLMMGSHFVYLGLTIALVPHFGLKGVVMAQLIQSLSLMLALWLGLKWHLKQLPMIPSYWNFQVLKDMFGYGVNFQVITIVNMLFEPIVKAMMSKFGGLEALGYYEMANKLILQGRALIANASRVMVPAVAVLQETDENKARRLFMASYRLTFYVSVVFFGMLGIFISSISMLWLGSYETTFIQYALLLNLGWFVNTLINPAYFSNLGTGKLIPNMVAHTLIGLISPIVGGGLGLYYGGVGVVLGMVVGLSIGSIYVLIEYFYRSELEWKNDLIPQNMSLLMFFMGIAVVLSNFGSGIQQDFTSVMTISLLCSFFMLMLGWFNPARKEMLKRLSV